MHFDLDGHEVTRGRARLLAVVAPGSQHRSAPTATVVRRRTRISGGSLRNGLDRHFALTLKLKTVTASNQWAFDIDPRQSGYQERECRGQKRNRAAFPVFDKRSRPMKQEQVRKLVDGHVHRIRTVRNRATRAKRG